MKLAVAIIVKKPKERLNGRGRRQSSLTISSASPSSSFRQCIFLFVAASGLHLGIVPLFYQQHTSSGCSGPFVSSLSLSSLSSSSFPPSRLAESKTDGSTDNNRGRKGALSRRDLLGSTMSGAAAVSGSSLFPWLAGIEAAGANDDGLGEPVAILGASGRTGSLCVDAVRIKKSSKKLCE